MKYRIYNKQNENIKVKYNRQQDNI